MLNIFFRLLAEEDVPGAATVEFGVSSGTAVFILLGIIFVVWLILRSQSSRDDLHAVDDHAGHDDHAAHDHDAHAETHEEKAEAPAPAEPDELKKIEGIGPKVATLLNENGINTFAELAAASEDKLDEILASADYQYMDAGSWPEQGKLAAAGDWDALQKLQDELQGGR